MQTVRPHETYRAPEVGGGEGGWECREAVSFATIQKMSQAWGNESLFPSEHTTLCPHTQPTLSPTGTVLPPSMWTGRGHDKPVGGCWPPLPPPGWHWGPGRKEKGDSLQNIITDPWRRQWKSGLSKNRLVTWVFTIDWGSRGDKVCLPH